MTEFVDSEGKPLKGIALINAQRKAAKAATQAGEPLPPAGKVAEAAAPVETQPDAPVADAPKAGGRPKIDAAPAPEPAPEPESTEPTAYDEILAAIQAHNPAFATQHPKETGTGYLIRLLTNVLDVPDEILPWSDDKNGFENLSDGANSWISRATGLFKETKTVPTDLPGWADKAGSAKAPKATKEKKVKEPKAPKEKKVKPPKEKKVRPDGAVRRIKRWLVQNPDADIKAVNSFVDSWEPGEKDKPSPATQLIAFQSVTEVIMLARQYGKWVD